MTLLDSSTSNTRLVVQAEVHRRSPQERARQPVKHQKPRDRLKELVGVPPR